VARSIAGQSKRKIAVEEHLDRGTVSRILSQPEIAAIRQETISGVYHMKDKALEALEDLIRQRHAATVIAYFQGLGIFTPHSKHTVATPAQEELQRRGLADKTDEEIEYFLAHGYFPHERRGLK
jgi:hypothetical protein